MNPTGGGATPWKARWALVAAGVIAIIVAPNQVGAAVHGFFHGTGTVACSAVQSACDIDPEHPALPGAQTIATRSTAYLPSPQNGPPANWNQRNGD